MHSYTPRRASKRWLDADCPTEVLAIFDNRGQSADRYTVFFKTVYETHGQRYMFYLGMSGAPFHPQGVGMSGELQPHQVAAYRYRNKHRAAKWSALPADVQKCVSQFIRED
jgi:hypothetical protein